MSTYNKGTSLISYYNYPQMVTNEGEIIKQRRAYEEVNKFLPRKMVDQTCYVGVEVEVEKIAIGHPHMLGWNVVPDGSLRNNGAEFVSLPIRGQNIHYLLHGLLTTLKKEGAEFTERTSIHVHMNVRRLTVEQLVTLLIVYFVVEQSLYRFIHRAGFERSRNIFCVPLSESQHYLGVPYLIYLLKENNIRVLLDQIHQQWRKYSGLNLLPVSTQGTVEFRQLGGTMDVDIIMDWINIIQSIRLYALSHTLEETKTQIFELNTNSNYQAFLRSVFGRYADHMFPQFGGKFEELEAGVMNVKEAFLLRDNFGINKEKFESSSIKKFIESRIGKLETYDDELINKEIEACEKRVNKFQDLVASGIKGEQLKIAQNEYRTARLEVSILYDKKSIFLARVSPSKSLAMTTMYGRGR